MSEASIVAITVAVIGSGILQIIATELFRRLDRHRSKITSEDLKGIEAKLDRDYSHLQSQDERLDATDSAIRDVRLIVLRQCLFARPP